MATEFGAVVDHDGATTEKSVEGRLKASCQRHGIVYEEPSAVETDAQCALRRKTMRRKLDNVRRREARWKKRPQNTVEGRLKAACQNRGIDYEEPPADETREQCENRRKRLRLGLDAARKRKIRSVKKKEEGPKKQRHKYASEGRLKVACQKNGVEYEGPSANETEEQCEHRKMKLRRLLDAARKRGTRYKKKGENAEDQGDERRSNQQREEEHGCNSAKRIQQQVLGEGLSAAASGDCSASRETAKNSTGETKGSSAMMSESM